MVITFVGTIFNDALLLMDNFLGWFFKINWCSLSECIVYFVVILDLNYLAHPTLRLSILYFPSVTRLTHLVPSLEIIYIFYLLFNPKTVP